MILGTSKDKLVSEDVEEVLYWRAVATRSGEETTSGIVYCEACRWERTALPLDESLHIKTIGVLTICVPKPLLERGKRTVTGGWQ